MKTRHTFALGADQLRQREVLKSLPLLSNQKLPQTLTTYLTTPLHVCKVRIALMTPKNESIYFEDMC